MSSTVEVVEVVPSKAKNGKDDLFTLSYKHLTGNFKGQVWHIKALAKALSSESRSLLKSAKPGEKLAIDRSAYQYTTADGQTKVGYNLSAVERAVSTGTRTSSAGTSSDKDATTTSTASHTTTGTTYTERKFDDVGIKVGAARNQALAFLSATKGTKFTLDDVDTIAYEIVIRQAAQEKNIREGNNPASVTDMREQDQFGSDTNEFFE